MNKDHRIYTSTYTDWLLLCTELCPWVCIILSNLFISVRCGNAGDRISRGPCKEGSSWGVSVSLGFPRVVLLGGWRCGCVTKRNNVSSSQNSCAHCEIPLLLSRVGQPGDALRILKATHYRENMFIFQLSTKETPLILLHCRGFPAPQDNKNYIFHVPLELFPHSFIYKNLSCVKCTFSPVWLKKLEMYCIAILFH